MDTFEATLNSFENPSDQHNFMEYFQQQQQNALQQSVFPSHEAMNSSINAQNSMSNNNNNNGQSMNAKQNSNLSSPTATLLRSSASPTSYDQLAGDTTIATTASTNSPSSPFTRQGSTSATPVSTSKMAKGSKTSFAPSHQIHPMAAATPNRHNSLPFDQSSLSQQQQPLQSRLIAGSSSRGFSTGSPSSNAGSPNLMRPPPIQTMSLSNGSSNSGQQADFLNPHGGLSTSPSPLRTSSPLGMQSPYSLSRQSPGDGSHDLSDHSPALRSPSPYSTSFTNGAASNAKGADGTPSDASGAASAKFVHKLFRMVSDTDYQHLISWNASGTSVVVTNFDEFAKEVLGKHFKHSNFSSFIRQLNMYGFYKVNKTPRGHRHAVDTQVWEFSHPKFLRGHPELLDDIRRKALDSEHARVEARDLQYSVSVGHIQLRQQVDDQQYRIEELFEMNVALRQVVGGLRDTLSSVLEWVKVNNGGQLPFESRLQSMEMPPTPMMHPYMQDAAWGGASGADTTVADGPPIFVTEPAFHSQQHPSIGQDVFSMSSMGQVSPIGSRRVSMSSQSGGEGSSVGKLSLDTNQIQQQFGNPGLGVLGLSNSHMMAAINTPLPPSPAAIHSGPQIGGYNDSPFLASPSMASFPGQAPGTGYFSAVSSPMTTSVEDEDTMLGPNLKSMRTQMKRTASNSGQHQMAVQAALQNHAQYQQQQQKRKSPGV